MSSRYAARIAAWVLLLSLHVAHAAAASQAAGTVRALHNLPGHQAHAALAAGGCVAWRIDGWKGEDLHADAAAAPGSTCPQHALRIQQTTQVHDTEGCALHQLQLSALLPAAVQNASGGQQQHQQQRLHNPSQLAALLQALNERTEPSSGLHVAHEAEQQVYISIRSTCSTATDVLLQLRRVTTANHPHQPAQLKPSSVGLLLRRKPPSRSTVRLSSSMWSQRRLLQQPQGHPQQPAQQQVQHGGGPSRQPWAHNPTVCCCPVAGGRSNATTVLTKQSHVPPDGQCCCGTFNECCAQATGNNGQSTSTLASKSSSSGSGGNNVVIMAVLISVSVALIAGILMCIFCCYRRNQRNQAVLPVRQQRTRRSRPGRGDPVKAAEEMRSVVKTLPEGDSKADEDCPICMEAVATGDWQVLPCGHGVCTHCFDTLVAREARLTVCPMCRTRVLTPSPEEQAAAAAAAAEAQAAAAARLAAAALPPSRRSLTDSASSTRQHSPAGSSTQQRQRQEPTFGGLALSDYGIISSPPVQNRSSTRPAPGGV